MIAYVFCCFSFGFSTFCRLLWYAKPASHGEEIVPKPLFFLCFCMIFTYRKMFAQTPKRYKIAPGACQTQLPTKIVLKTRFGAEFGRVWGSLGRHLGGSWAVLGASWRLLGASWAPLGHFLGALGRLLAGLGRFLAAFRIPGTPRTPILEGSGTCRARFWKAPGACFSMLFAAPRTSLHDAFIHA